MANIIIDCEKMRNHNSGFYCFVMVKINVRYFSRVDAINIFLSASYFR